MTDDLAASNVASDDAAMATRRHRHECETLWPYVWHHACRLDEIETVGSFVEFCICHRSVLVVRGKQGVRAFLNRCPHRGVRIVDGAGICGGRLTCQYHGWQWSLDGINRFHLKQHLVNEKDRDPATLNLSQCRAEIFAGSVFVNFDPDAEALAISDGDGPPRHTTERDISLPVAWYTAMPVLVRRLAEIDGAGRLVERLGPITGRGSGSLFPSDTPDVVRTVLAPAEVLLAEMTAGRTVSSDGPDLVLPNHVRVKLEGGAFALRIHPSAESACHVGMTLDDH